MRVLCVNPNREQMPWPVIPVGLSMVATALDTAGHDVAFADLTFEGKPARAVERAVRRHQPELVALSIRNIDNCNFDKPAFFLPEIREQVVAPLRAHAPAAPLVVGGAAVNVCPTEILEYLDADFAIVGEGEDALPALIRALESGSDVRSIPGVIARRAARGLPLSGSQRGEPPRGRARAEAVAGRFSRAHRWVDLRRYAELGTPYPIQTKRGCALECSYCVYNEIEGRRYRLRDPADVVDEMEDAVAHGVTQIEIVDSTFNLPLSHARALCAELERRRLPVELSTMGLNPTGVTDELVEAMKRAGFTTLMCTPESASEVTLASLNKGFGKPAIERTARALARAGIPTWWFFLIGAPGETLDTVRETLAFCEEHIPESHLVLFSTGIRVYAGTPLARHCRETGWFSPTESLFEPSWYLSPELDLDELCGTLASAALAHPNWMTNAETVISPTFATLMKRGFRALGKRGPFWLHLPQLFSLATRFGGRQRGFALAAKNLQRLRDVRHHR
ncbi:MAG: cobalamin-dependent protein [Polyangiaceae bacterium]|nr:cobalamin-dependent protein [Polyangiaceae bacterium]